MATSKPSDTNYPKFFRRVLNYKCSMVLSTNVKFRVECRVDRVEENIERITPELRTYNLKLNKLIKAVIAAGIHLFPSRTEKLSPQAPMVLHYNVGE